MAHHPNCDAFLCDEECTMPEQEDAMSRVVASNGRDFGSRSDAPTAAAAERDLGPARPLLPAVVVEAERYTREELGWPDAVALGWIDGGDKAMVLLRYGAADQLVALALETTTGNCWGVYAETEEDDYLRNGGRRNLVGVRR